MHTYAYNNIFIPKYDIDIMSALCNIHGNTRYISNIYSKGRTSIPGYTAEAHSVFVKYIN